jgi:hypothetical protein
MIGSNYFDLAMVMDYWGPKRLNHHTEATTMLYGARNAPGWCWAKGWPIALPAMPPRARDDGGVARHGATRVWR